MWSRFSSPHWLPGGDGIIFEGATPRIPRGQIWYVSYPEGELRRVTEDSNDYRSVKVSRDGKTIAAGTRLGLVSLWSINPANQKVRQIKAQQRDISNFSISAMPNGRLVLLRRSDFRRSDSGTSVFSMNEDGTDEKEMFSVKARISRLVVSPDGEDLVAAVSTPDARGFDIYRFDADGSGRQRLTNFEVGYLWDIQVIPGGWVLFSRYFGTRSIRNDPSVIMRVPIKGGKAEEIAGLEPSERDQKARLSPDGKYLAYQASLKDEGDGKIKEYIRVTEFSDGEAGDKILEKQLDVPRIRWFPDSSAIVYEKSTGLGNLYKLDLKTQKETRISDFNLGADTGQFTWNRDGTSILALRGSYVENFVLIRDRSVSSE